MDLVGGKGVVGAIDLGNDWCLDKVVPSTWRHVCGPRRSFQIILRALWQPHALRFFLRLPFSPSSCDDVKGGELIQYATLSVAVVLLLPFKLNKSDALHSCLRIVNLAVVPAATSWLM